LDVKRLISQDKLFYRKKGEREKTVLLAKLQQRLTTQLKKKTDVVLDSHLLCEFCLPLDVMVVLRCPPEKLKARLKRRRYSKAKTRDNLLCEALDYCLVQAEAHYPKVLQLNSEKPFTPRTLFARIVQGKADAANWQAWLENNAHEPGLKHL
ncbi:MAG: AAA family ATPase, partial [Candidatus Micrarchaeota archaeon]|nr:AAA family ATPase [Candidatus Micrarchaeota archaeon]